MPKMLPLSLTPMSDLLSAFTPITAYSAQLFVPKQSLLVSLYRVLLHIFTALSLVEDLERFPT